MSEKKINRNYCLTFFKLFEINEWEQPNNINYAIFGKETCPKTGEKHIHGYIELSRPMRMKAVKKIFNDDTLHVELRRGSQEQAILYTKKEGEFTEFGIPSKQGKRNDLILLTQDIKQLMSTKDIIEKYPVQYLLYNRGIEKTKSVILKCVAQNFRKLTVHVYYGKTGTGKTKTAIENSIDKGYFKLDPGNKTWFDGYDSEKVLIIDDFYGWLQFGFLLNILDGYQLRLEIKCGFTYALWDEVYITSNKHPDKWYPGINDLQTKALFRRITEIKEFM